MLRNASLSPCTSPLPFLPSPPPLPDKPRNLIFTAAQKDPETSEAERQQVWLERIQVFADSIQAHESAAALNAQIQSTQNMINSTIFKGLPAHTQTKMWKLEASLKMQLEHSKLVEYTAIDTLTASAHWPLGIISGLENSHCSAKHKRLLSLVYDLKTTATRMRDVLNNLVNVNFSDPSHYIMQPQDNSISLQPPPESKEILEKLSVLESTVVATHQSLCGQNYKQKVQVQNERQKQRDRLHGIEEAVREARRTHKECKEAFEEVQLRVDACIVAHKEDQIKLQALEATVNTLPPLSPLPNDFILQCVEETISDQCNDNIQISVEILRQDIKALLQKQNAELRDGLFLDLQITQRVIGKVHAISMTGGTKELEQH